LRFNFNRFRLPCRRSGPEFCNLLGNLLDRLIKPARLVQSLDANVFKGIAVVNQPLVGDRRQCQFAVNGLEVGAVGQCRPLRLPDDRFIKSSGCTNKQAKDQEGSAPDFQELERLSHRYTKRLLFTAAFIKEANSG
jgi:hypothetical protein